MADCLVILGREEALALAELTAYTRVPPAYLVQSVAEITIDDPRAAMRVLGGAVKIAVRKATNTNDVLLATLLDLLKARMGRHTFGISVYGMAPEKARTLSRGLGNTLKRELTRSGHRARFVVSREPQLSAVSVDKEKLLTQGVEFILTKTNAGWIVGETVAVQDFRAWSARDYGKPFRDPRTGMLPPKLARMMVNLAQVPEGGTILDPFCGSGTMLMEALLLGYQAVGADANPAMTAGTEKNREWLTMQPDLRTTPLRTTHSVLQSDARTISKRLKGEKIDAIITEPYLGPPLKGREGVRALMEIKGRLEALYAAALKDWEKILKKGSALVVALPVFRVRDGKPLTIDDAIYTCTSFRPQPLLPAPLASHLPKAITPRGGILYGRPNQHVWREIVRLTH